MASTSSAGETCHYMYHSSKLYNPFTAVYNENHIDSVISSFLSFIALPTCRYTFADFLPEPTKDLSTIFPSSPMPLSPPYSHSINSTALSFDRQSTQGPQDSLQSFTEGASLTTSSPTNTSTYTSNIQGTQSHQDDRQDHTSEKMRMARSVAVPIAAITLTLFGVFAWHKYRTWRVDVSNEVETNRAASLLIAQPYLQQKAELEDEERRIHELEASTRRGELEGNPIIHEIAGEDRIAQVLRETSTQRGFERVSTIPSSNG